MHGGAYLRNFTVFEEKKVTIRQCWKYYYSYLKGHVSFQSFILKGHNYSKIGLSLISIPYLLK